VEALGEEREEPRTTMEHAEKKKNQQGVGGVRWGGDEASFCIQGLQLIGTHKALQPIIALCFFHSPWGGGSKGEGAFI